MWLRDARAARADQAARRSRISTTRNTFRIAGARRSGPTSAARCGDDVDPRACSSIGGATRRHGRRDRTRARHQRPRSCPTTGTRRFASAYGPTAARRRRRRPRSARSSIKGEDLGGDLNVGPAISPDGRWIAFLSERSLFSIDLFVADASTGKIVRKLTSTASDPHLLEHPVHLLGRRLGRGEPADRDRDGRRRAGRRSRSSTRRAANASARCRSRSSTRSSIRRGRPTATRSASPA